MAAQDAMLLQALQATMAPQDEVRKPAEEALVNAGNGPGFIQALLGIIANSANDADLRLVAIICLKRSLKSHWKPRKAGVYGLGEDEKAGLKQWLLGHLEEPERKVAVQLAVVVADIARRDWPGDWEPLFTSLLSTVHSTSDLAIARAVYMLHRVLKELSTKRLARDRAALAAVSVQLFPVLAEVWLARSSQLLSALVPWAATHGSSSLVDDEALIPLAELVTHLIKCLYRITLSGFPNTMQAGATGIAPADIAEFFENLLAHEKSLLQAAVACAGCGGGQAGSVEQLPTLKQVAKLLYRLSLIPIEAQTQSPLPFRPFLGPFLATFYDQLIGLYTDLPAPPGVANNASISGVGYPSTPATAPPSLERTAINALKFLTNVLSCDEYKVELLTHHATSSSSRAVTATGDQEMSAAAVSEAAGVVNGFFTPERCRSLLHFCVHKLLPLRTPDLEEWESDPEAYQLSHASLTRKESPRTAAEHFVVCLLDERSEALAPPLAQLLSDSAGLQAAAAAEAAGAKGGTVSAEVLTWDARLLAAGLCAEPLAATGVDFSAWFINTLAPCLTVLASAPTSDDTPPPVLRRRLLWLVGVWMGQMQEAIRPSLVEALVQMLTACASGCDAAVSLTLLRTLNCAVDNWEFNVEAFRPLTGVTVTGLYGILGTFSELDARLQVMDLLHLVLRVVGPEGVKPFVEVVVAPLGSLWHSAATTDETAPLLQKRVLNVLNVVTNALSSEDAARLHPLALPMLGVATDLKRPEADYALEDGLELWASTLSQAPAYSSDLHALFAHLPPVLNRDLEFLQVAMQLVEAYVIMGAGSFFETHAGAVTTIFNATVAEVSQRGAAYVAAAIETVLRRFPNEGADMLRQGGVLSKLLATVMESEADDRSGNGGGGIGGAPSMMDHTISTHYVCLLARVAFTAPEQLRALFHMPGVSDGSPPEVLARLLQLVDVMLKRFRSVGGGSDPSGPWHRKLVALALVSFLPADPNVLQRLDAILSVCVDVLAEHQAPGFVMRPWSHSERLNEGCDQTSATTTSDRYTTNLRAMLQGDPVQTLDLKSFLQQKMNETQASVGAAAFQSALAAVDPVLLQQLQ